MWPKYGICICLQHSNPFSLSFYRSWELQECSQNKISDTIPNKRPRFQRTYHYLDADTDVSGHVTYYWVVKFGHKAKHHHSCAKCPLMKIKSDFLMLCNIPSLVLPQLKAFGRAFLSFAFFVVFLAISSNFYWGRD